MPYRRGSAVTPPPGTSSASHPPQHLQPSATLTGARESKRQPVPQGAVEWQLETPRRPRLARCKSREGGDPRAWGGGEGDCRHCGTAGGALSDGHTVPGRRLAIPAQTCRERTPGGVATRPPPDGGRPLLKIAVYCALRQAGRDYSGAPPPNIRPGRPAPGRVGVDPASGLSSRQLCRAVHAPRSDCPRGGYPQGPKRSTLFMGEGGS